MIDVCFSEAFAEKLESIQEEIKSDGIFFLWRFLNIGNIACEDLIAEQVRTEVQYSKYFTKSITDEELEEGAKRLIEYYYTQQWDGKLPETVLGSDDNLLIGVGGNN